MTVSRFRTGLCVAILIGASPAFADCDFSGTVKTGNLPLEGATVDLTRLGDGVVVGSATTKRDGTYQLRYSGFDATLRAIQVDVRAPGLSDDSRLLWRRGTETCLAASKYDVVLEPAAHAPTDFSRLGLTIFVSPYAIFGDEGDSIGARFNANLPTIVYHGIFAYSNRLPFRPEDIDISVQSMDESVSTAEGERILRLGHSLNALGVIAGDGEILGDGEDQLIAMTSIFRTIPRFRDHIVVPQPIYDEIPVEHIRPSRLGGLLNAVWGKQAVLSYVLQRLSTHNGPWRQADLDTLANVLIGVRSTMAADDRLLAPLERLLDEIEGMGMS